MPHEFGKWFENKKYEFADDLKIACDKYFKSKKIDGKPLTIAGLCSAIGVERHWISKQHSDDPAIKKIIQWAQDKILADKEERLNAQVAGVIFDLKNNYPHLYKDKIEISSKIDIDTVIKIIRCDDNAAKKIETIEIETIETEKKEDKNGL